MSLIEFDNLPAGSRLFIFNTERPLTADESIGFADHIRGFLDQWTTHKQEMSVGFRMLHNRFLMIGVDESKLPPSGCSIDDLTRYLTGLGRATGIEIVDAPDLCFVADDGSVQCVDRARFAALAEQGEITTGTIVFDRTVGRTSDLDRWSIPAGESWHARAFDLKAATTP